jgi:hypothetical protein
VSFRNFAARGFELAPKQVAGSAARVTRPPMSPAVSISNEGNLASAEHSKPAVATSFAPTEPRSVQGRKRISVVRSPLPLERRMYVPPHLRPT